jgi:hypothetical protein
VVLIVLSIIFGVMAYMSYSDLWDPAINKQNDREEAANSINNLEQEIAAQDRAANEIREKICFQRQRGEYWATVWQEYNTGNVSREKMEQAGKDQVARVAASRDKIVKDRQDLAQESRQKADKEREEGDKAAAAHRDKAKEAGTRKDEVQQAIVKLEADFKRQDTQEKSLMSEYKRQLEALTSRDIERAGLLREIDGRVILSDPQRNLVVIDRGTADKVRNGYRFEVFGLQIGRTKLHKGYLEVRRATPSFSECYVVARTLRLPRDPLSSYIASSPEELYSPYHESGKRGANVQMLTGEPKSVELSQNRDDPIIKGDYVQNPFYHPNRSYTFYVAGDKTVVHGLQKSAIVYPWKQIQQVLENYGCRVSPTVDLHVDYVIAQKNPQEDKEYEKAVRLGIPVIYEWELFRFLDQQ